MSLLKEIETLSRLHRTGELSDSEFAAAKAAILEEVPEAVLSAETPHRVADGVLPLLCACLLPPLLLGGTAFVLGLPASLSLTLAVTLLAAIVVAQFRRGET
ncbi:SHOCT domain-containing protein [Oceaniglobus roseus]|uniref:SHOCT domain-containing protein n=1 Tax=Oceaniglobus roseus TaxID=1737570 RepID=UPI000C7EB8DE|nr:SHOCT domain-containing protein [Kandeliimicrobium roseum]